METTLKPIEEKNTSIVSINEFLTFKLGSEEYGMDILHVQEIRSYEQPTRMINSSNFVKGVVNLRGVIVPIIDMRLKFNLENVEYNDFTIVIVINVKNQVLGIVVDGVSDVISFKQEQLHPVPGFTSVINNEHVIAIGSIGDRMLILLDVEKLMSSDEMGLIVKNIT